MARPQAKPKPHFRQSLFWDVDPKLPTLFFQRAVPKLAKEFLNID